MQGTLISKSDLSSKSKLYLIFYSLYYNPFLELSFQYLFRKLSVISRSEKAEPSATRPMSGLSQMFSFIVGLVEDHIPCVQKAPGLVPPVFS